MKNNLMIIFVSTIIGSAFGAAVLGCHSVNAIITSFLASAGTIIFLEYKSHREQADD